MKQLIVFDLDGTLAESKSSVDPEMVTILNSLLRVAKVGIISGGDWPQFEKQILAKEFAPEGLSNLSLLPTCGTKFYTFKSEWLPIYSEDLSGTEKKKIISSLRIASELLGFVPAKTWGEIIEDRGSQITYSALGQDAPLEEKKAWDPDFFKRKQMQVILSKSLSDFSVRLGGTTSIDVTRIGIDKAYGISKLTEILGIAKEEMIFVGDAIFPGGNDYAVKEAGVDSIEVRDSTESKRVIEAIIACLI
jgi:phosphomannomutase